MLFFWTARISVLSDPALRWWYSRRLPDCWRSPKDYRYISPFREWQFFWELKWFVSQLEIKSRCIALVHMKNRGYWHKWTFRPRLGNPFGSRSVFMVSEFPYFSSNFVIKLDIRHWDNPERWQHLSYIWNWNKCRQIFQCDFRWFNLAVHFTLFCISLRLAMLSYVMERIHRQCRIWQPIYSERHPKPFFPTVDEVS